jgi:hypothetical protein
VTAGGWELENTRMMTVFVPEGREMVRRTVHLPDRIDDLVREAAEDGESYSAAVTRLLETGMQQTRRSRPS